MTVLLDDEPGTDVELYTDVDPTLLPPVRPAYVWRPPRVRSMAPQLEQLAVRLGRPLDAEQVEVVDVMTGERRDGTPPSLVSCAIAARQNVKSWAMELIAFGLLLRPQHTGLVVWSAHELTTAQRSFKDMVTLIEMDDHAWLRRYVRAIRRTNGQQSIIFGHPKWARDRELLIKARQATGGRGLTGDVVVLDEGFALEDTHVGSLIPILSTIRHARVMVGSSAGLVGSAVLRGIRNRGRKGGVGAPAYIEFKAPGSFAEPPCDLGRECRHEPGTPGCALDRLDYVVQANPAARAGRISVDYLRNERLLFPPREYARERLGWWEDPEDSATGISAPAWKALADPESRPRRMPLGVGVDIPPGGLPVVAGVGLRDGGDADGVLGHVEILLEADDVAALVEYLDRLSQDLACVVRILGGSSTAKILKPRLDRAGVPYVETSQADYAAGCALLAGDVRERRLRHLGDAALQREVRGAATVPVGDSGAWRWSPAKSSVQIPRLVAVTLARWQLEVDPQADYDAADSVG